MGGDVVLVIRGVSVIWYHKCIIACYFCCILCCAVTYLNVSRAVAGFPVCLISAGWATSLCNAMLSTN